MTIDIRYRGTLGPKGLKGAKTFQNVPENHKRSKLISKNQRIPESKSIR